MADKKMFQNRRLAKCCGNSLLKAYAPELALLSSEGRWEDWSGQEWIR